MQTASGNGADVVSLSRYKPGAHQVVDVVQARRTYGFVTNNMDEAVV